MWIFFDSGSELFEPAIAASNHVAKARAAGIAPPANALW